MPAPAHVVLPEIHFIGIRTVTSNAQETEPGCGAIPALWKSAEERRVFDKIPSRTADAVCGVYSNFESGQDGSYTVLVGAEVEEGAPVPKGFSRVSAPAHGYLAFRGTGVDPAAVLAVWQEIWAYFTQPTRYARAFEVDFERYDKHKPEPLTVFVSVTTTASE